MICDRVRRLTAFVFAGALATSALLAPTGVANAAPADLPDFQLSYSVPSTLLAGEPFAFKVQVANVGMVATENGQLVEVRTIVRPRHPVTSVEVSNPKFTCAIDNSQIESGSGLPFSEVTCKTKHAFAAGETAVFVVHATASNRPGSARLRATVDPDNLVDESNEHNNIIAGVLVTN